jgi:preprotein translocase subunit SecG
MIIILFVIHVMIALTLIGVVMLQKSEGGALGMGGGGGMSGFMTGRSTANLLTRTTAILAVLFFATSIILVKLSSPGGAPRSIVDDGPPASSAPLIPAAPAGAPAAPEAPAPAAPAQTAPAQTTPPAEPSAPLAR